MFLKDFPPLPIRPKFVLFYEGMCMLKTKMFSPSITMLENMPARIGSHIPAYFRSPRLISLDGVE